MEEGGFPSLHTFYDYFSNRIEANERARFRYLASLGSVATAAAFLIWQVINLVEALPSLWSIPALLSLIVLVYLMLLYANSLLSIEELLQSVTEAGKSELDERLKWLFVRQNLARLRFDVTVVQVRDILFSAVPLFAISLASFAEFPGTGTVAGVLGLFRLALAIALTGLFLWAVQPKFLDAYLEGIEVLERRLEEMPKLREVALKLVGLQRVAGPLLKTAFYGVQLAAVFVVLVTFVEAVWTVLRLTLLLLGVSLLGWFALYFLKHIGRLQEETSVWADLRIDVLFEQFGSPREVRSAIREAVEDVIVARAFPYLVPDEVLEAISGFPKVQGESGEG